MEENKYQSIILVTSRWHSKRAYLTFKYLFRHDPEFSIVVCPSGYSTFDAANWWKNENDIELVFREYVRIIVYILSSRMSLIDIAN